MTIIIAARFFFLHLRERFDILMRMNALRLLDAPMLIGSKQFDFSRRTHVMGILNVTPDSFSDGGQYNGVEAALARARDMVEQGADIIDVGGESTRPANIYGATGRISAAEELDRVIPVIERIAGTLDTVISIDTTKSAVADAALRAGAVMVNDISGLSFDDTMADVAARHHAAVVVMHIQGTPETMQLNPSYEDVIAEVKASLHASVRRAQSVGIASIIIDPGIGFGKNLDHNLTLLNHLEEFHDFHLPILIGTSRKGFIGTLLNTEVTDRLEGTAASVAVAVMHGANIIRVHDVKEMKRVATVVDAIRQAQ